MRVAGQSRRPLYKRIAHAIRWRIAPKTKDRLPMLLARLSRERHPVFVKVGANDGLSDDPCGDTFLRVKGWRGLLVEPVPSCVEQLRQTYREDRFEIAVGAEPGEATFYYVDERAAKELKDLPSTYNQLGSFDREHIVKHLDGVLEPYIEELVIRVETLDRLLAHHEMNKVDFLHIDTEGFDYEVLRGVDFDRNKPRSIYLEHKHLSDADRRQAVAMLERNGYHVLDCGVDYLATQPDGR